jgi:hypothetical protein
MTFSLSSNGNVSTASEGDELAVCREYIDFDDR